MSERLTSRSNPLFVHLHKLQTSRSYRAQTRQFCADGVKLLDEAVRWYPGLHTVIACDGLALPDLPEDVRLVRVPEGLMQSISTMRTPQGVVFLCRMPEEKPLCIEPGSLILDTIQDPGNLGTILRSADWFGADGVFASADTVEISNPKVVQATMGAIFRVKFARADIPALCRATRAAGGVVYGTFMDGANIYKEELCLGADRPALIVIGNEANGISPATAAEVSSRISIPSYGNSGMESLNAAVATAITLAEFRRRIL